MLGFRYGGFRGVPGSNHLLVQLDNPVTLVWGKVAAIVQRLGKRRGAGADSDVNGLAQSAAVIRDTHGSAKLDIGGEFTAGDGNNSGSGENNRTGAGAGFGGMDLQGSDGSRLVSY